MVKVINREICPYCRQTINSRRIVLTTQMVRALWEVYRYCLRTGRHEFQRKEIDPLLSKGTQYANWGYWKWFSGGLVYTPVDANGKSKGRGWWGINIERVRDFFLNKQPVWGEVWAKGKERNPTRKMYLREVPDIKVFLEGDEKYKEFVVHYG